LPRLGLLALVPLLLFGCDGGTSSRGRGPLVFTGTLVTKGRSSHVFELTKAGTVTVTLVDLNAALVDVTSLFNPSTAFVGLGIGRPSGSGSGCTITGQTSLAKGQRQLYGLQEVTYCATLFDSGTFPPDATFRYTLQIELP
jgi:hypothetical protein